MISTESFEEKTDSKREKIITVLLAVLIIAVLITISSLTTDRNADAVSANSKPVTKIYINEIMTNNYSYPDINGKTGDWIELHSNFDEDVDISGYSLADNETDEALLFGEGTVIPADGYIMVSCGEETVGFSAPFSLSKKGGDVIALLNNTGDIIDILEIPPLDKDTTLARNHSLVWYTEAHPTPLFENNYSKYDKFIVEENNKGNTLIINEVVSKNLGSAVREDGVLSDWIEIVNVSSEYVDLKGYFLSDDVEDVTKHPLPQKILAPNEIYVVFAQANSEAEGIADFGISSNGEHIYLHSWRGILCDEVKVPDMPANYSYARFTDGSYQVTPYHSPYEENSITAKTQTAKLTISEICPVNRSGLRDSNDEWSDWIEITNAGNEAVYIGDYWLSTDEENIYQYSLPDVMLDVKKSIVVFAAKNEQGNPYYTGDGLSNNDGKIGLYAPNGHIVDTAEYFEAEIDVSYIHSIDGSNVNKAEYYTPGYTNDLDGYSAYLESIYIDSPLIINEVMTINTKYMPQSMGRCYDWVELKNISDESINLKNYSLTDEYDLYTKCQLPDVILKSGEMFIVYCSSDSSLTSSAAFHADFSLSSAYSPLYLVDFNGNTLDYMTLRNIAPNTSFGRIENSFGYYYFEEPTPKSENRGGRYGVLPPPAAAIPAGVYADKDRLTIELEGTDEIHYTLDGTLPNENSALYSGGIEIDKPTVIRCMACSDSMMDSEVASYTYIVGRDHELPILSLSVNPSDLYSPDSGIYVKGNSEKGNYNYNWEKDANLTYFDPSGDGFSINCGLRMHGGGSRTSDNKKSMKVVFRSKYGEKSLVYDIFGQNVPNEFTSLVLRAGEDYRYTVFRSELITGLAKEANGDALTQAHKYCALYVNGEYFGIFALMERYNEEYYAARYNVSPKSVEIVDAINIPNTDFYDIIKYCENNDMSTNEAYEYIDARVDLDNVIDWCIFQAYSSNTDIPNNVRLMHSSEGDAKWRYCFYDLDWTMRHASPSFSKVFEAFGEVFTLPKAMMENERFRNEFSARANELRLGTLSDENVLNRIDEYYDLLQSELPSDREKWNLSMTNYEAELQELKSMINDNDRWTSLIKSLEKYE